MHYINSTLHTLWYLHNDLHILIMNDMATQHYNGEPY